jgi:hypothetical protein
MTCIAKIYLLNDQATAIEINSSIFIETIINETPYKIVGTHQNVDWASHEASSGQVLSKLKQ